MGNKNGTEEEVNQESTKPIKNTEEDKKRKEKVRNWTNATIRKGKMSELQKTIKTNATLGVGEEDITEAIKKPEDIDLDEWIAANTMILFNSVSNIFGQSVDFCTEESCKTMTAGNFSYLWKDDEKYKTATEVSAPIYMANLLDWTARKLEDEDLFPIDENVKFPANFKKQVKVIFKRLFRVYAHFYHSHFINFKDCGIDAHLNSCFKHFVFFAIHFGLLTKDDIAPVKRLVLKFVEQYKIQLPKGFQ